MLKVKKIADLENMLTKSIARQILALEKPTSDYYKAKPSWVSFHARKPAFYLGDYDTLSLYTFDLATGEMLGKVYCGSYDSIINGNNFAMQQSEGLESPKGVVSVFVTRGAGVWHLDCVSSDLAPMLPQSK